MTVFWHLYWWQWLALVLTIPSAWALAHLLSRATRAVLGRIAARTAATWDDVLVKRLAGPLTLSWFLAICYGVLPWLELSPRTVGWIKRGLHGLLLVALFWALFRVVDVVAEGLKRSRWSRDQSASRALIPLGTRVAKVGLAAASVVMLLSELGYPVASLLAGLGIGGLAVALAARSTLENLFGAFSIGADQPFREGDVVKIEDFVGTVEAVGLRSTKIRTLDRTLISFPNGKLADMKVESYSARDRLRLACTVGLVYETTAEQMRAVLAGLESVLRKHPKIWPDDVVVRFKELAASSLDIEVMAWFLTRDWGEFQSIRQEILLQFMEVVAAAGTSFAFPTQTVHVATDAPPNRSAITRGPAKI
jgi:MscS family membrane protein